MTDPRIPQRKELQWPTIKALKSIGGSASIQEISDQIAADLSLPDEVVNAPYKNTPQSVVDYRAAWARTDLRLAGAIENSSRGVWTLTEAGRNLRSEEEMRLLIDSSKTGLAGRQRRDLDTASTDGADIDEEIVWKQTLLEIIREMQPDAFERLCRRVLLESGFGKVNVTGRTGDGGIDGTGVLQLNLISVQIYFQCKKYRGSVGSSEIRNFQGAISGRRGSGLFLTTGSYTSAARREALRDGAPPIDLIDGSGFCDILKERELGVRIVEKVEPDPEFFKQF